MSLNEVFEIEDEETAPSTSPLRSKRRPDRTAAAGPWRLIGQKLVRQKVAMVAGAIVLLLYLVAAFCEFLAPGLPETSKAQYTYAPPQPIEWLVTDANGTRFFPHVAGYSVKVDPVALRRTFVVDNTKVIPVGFFVHGERYKFWNLFPTDIHFFGPTRKTDPMYLIGADRLGRDLLSRLIYGTRVSMSIGLAGVAISLLLGVTLGSLSGFYGGWVDTLVQRIIEVISAMPTIPLWLGLAAAIPVAWPPLQVYYIITVIVSLLGWTSLAREVRGRFLALRGEDFVTAARLDGSTERRVIFRHILPSLTSHILAVVTLAVPTMIVAETSLSFLGVGLHPPVVSWGVLLQDAQIIRIVATAPWLLIWPSAAVVLAVLSFNFFGDGLRDAADPYNT